MINKVIIVGHLGKDPEIRYSQDGVAVVNFSIATTETWKDKNSGEKREKTEWHRIVAFRRLGEICGEWLTKGQLVYIEGKIRTQSWEKDGITRYNTDIIANEMKMLGGSGGRQKNTLPQSPSATGGASGGSAEKTPMPTVEDDIPF